MTRRQESDEKYILDLVAEVLAEPGYLWQHRFPTLLGDPDSQGRKRPLPVDGYFPRHKLVVEYWEKQHSSPVPIMDAHTSISGVSRGHQRRLYDQRRQEWADAHGVRVVILDYRAFTCDPAGRLCREPKRDRLAVAQALRAADAVTEPGMERFDRSQYLKECAMGCFICSLAHGAADSDRRMVWRDRETMAFLSPYPAVYGHTLVALAGHYEHVAADLTLVQHLNLQRIVYFVARAVQDALKPERVYILSMGSLHTVAHIHWHVVPCPPGLPIEEQELALLDLERRGYLRLSEEEASDLVLRLRSHLPAWMLADQR